VDIADCRYQEEERSDNGTLVGFDEAMPEVQDAAFHGRKRPFQM